MSPSDGLDKLKNWQRAETGLMGTFSNLRGGIADLSVRVLSVNPSELVLSELGTDDCETADISMVVFSETVIGTGVGWCCN